jgi:uncharacterized protein (TIGR02147 family)
MKFPAPGSEAPAESIPSGEKSRAEVVRILQDELLRIRTRRTEFSLRSYARLLALNPTQLNETLQGRRLVTRKIATRVLDRLGYDPVRSHELVESIPAERARPKTNLGTRREGATPATVRAFTALSADEFRAVADWHCFAILSLAETRGFKSKPEWIGKRLGIPTRDAASAIESLVRLGLLEWSSTPGGARRLKPTGRQFTTTNDIPSTSIRRNHAQGLELAREALNDVPVELREFTATVLAIDPKRLPLAKERLRAIKRELAELLEAGTPREVYRLSIQLFPLSKPVSTKSGE